MIRDLFNVLIQHRFFRSLFSKKDFIKVDFYWIDRKDFKKGMKITDVESKRFTNANYCDCGNELVWSESFIRENRNEIYEYECSHCGKEQFWNPWLIPGCIPCDVKGKPL